MGLERIQRNQLGLNLSNLLLWILVFHLIIEKEDLSSYHCSSRCWSYWSSLAPSASRAPWRTDLRGHHPWAGWPGRGAATLEILIFKHLTFIINFSLHCFGQVPLQHWLWERPAQLHQRATVHADGRPRHLRRILWRGIQVDLSCPDIHFHQK